MRGTQKKLIALTLRVCLVKYIANYQLALLVIITIGLDVWVIISRFPSLEIPDAYGRKSVLSVEVSTLADGFGWRTAQRTNSKHQEMKTEKGEKSGHKYSRFFLFDYHIWKNN